MRYGTVAGVAKPVSRVVLGTMILSRNEQDRGNALLDAALELGCNTVDLAHGYGGGDSERVVGAWMQARGNRERMVILTKGCHHNQDRRRVTPYDLAADLFDSLARLQTSYVDIHLLHRDDQALPVGPIVEAYNEHLRAGRVRAFGGSNWSFQRLAEANAYAKSHGLQGFTASSPNFGLAEQVEDPWGPGCETISGPQKAEARAWYQANHMPVFAYSSLGRGFFSGRISRENWAQHAEKFDGAAKKAYAHECNFRRLDRLHQMAKDKNVTVPQLALAWISCQPLEVYALVGAANRTELEDSIKGSELKLTPAESAWLDLATEQVAKSAAG
jgi:aryl-alcohol dehydrogenase-like predicted oxidoreductase